MIGGSGLGALKRASPKGFTPQKLKDTIELLPNKFATLLELFGAAVRHQYPF